MRIVAKVALVHTIAIENEVRLNGTVTSTRKSEGRRYLACVVATATEATVRAHDAQKAKLEAELAECRAKLAGLEAKYGTTAAEVKAWHDEVEARWFDSGTPNPVGYHATKERIAKEQGFDRYSFAESLTLADLASRGYVKPFQAGTKYDVQAAQREVERREVGLSYLRVPVVGQQAVICWCGTAALAQKAAGGRDAKWVANQGWQISVRTDITVRETAKRAAKSAVAS